MKQTWSNFFVICKSKEVYYHDNNSTSKYECRYIRIIISVCCIIHLSCKFLIVITHVPDSGAQALTVFRTVPKTVVPDVRRAVSTTVRTAASPSAAHIAR